MSKHGDKLVAQRCSVCRSPLTVVTASFVPLGCAFGTMAAWTAHMAGAGIVLTAIAGHVGLQRRWSAAAVAPVAVASCLAATPLLWAEDTLYRAQQTLAAQLLAREPERHPRE